jgi:hypothetical protein
MTTLAQRIVARALSQVGYVEGPNNASKYGTWAGYPNQSWCAAYVSWVFSCERALGAVAQLPHGYINCASFMGWAKERHLLKSIINIVPGDILLYGWDATRVPEHTGIAVSAFDPKSHMVLASEGNTGGNVLGNQANGDGVYKRARPASCIVAVVSLELAVAYWNKHNPKSEIAL